ncbi:MAG: hypothetical protein Q8S00_15240 [Deltaproteobacteria bacterium]|nr:hypothetical protein [Deltaproteobacteria bacterium]MDZ4340981.1 hypothetical protein [Candidatus Binatia bacterium]
MKTITLAVLVSIVLSGLALASQSGDQKDHTAMMQEMMKGEKGMEGMSGMGGMMRMMKMMDQCGAMMESTHDQGEKAKESQNQ